MLPSRPALAPLVLIVLLAVVLFVLAAMQWHSIGQWSRSEEAHRQRTLNAGTEALDASVSATLRAVATAFGEVSANDASAPAALAARLDGWQTDADIPGLVAAVYWVAPGPDPLLYLLDIEQAPVLRTASWPPEWSPWREYFATLPGALAIPPGGSATVRHSGSGAPGSPVGLALPAIPPRGPAPLPLRFIFLLLDLEVLQTAVFEPLLATHVVDADAYDVIVTSREQPGVVLFVSRPGLDANGFAFSDVDRLIGPGALAQLELTFATTAPGVAAVVELSALEHDVSADDGFWRLRIRHRSGSIEAAVTLLRTRQLGLALAVLLVLGVATALIVHSAQVQRRLAQRQVEFVAGVTHELRTPLAVIRSAGENLADGLVEEVSNVRRYGALVRDESERLRRLVEGVLSLAGADSPNRAYEHIDFRTIVANASANARPVVAENNATLNVVLPDDPVWIHGEPLALETAVRNLIINAAQHGASEIRLGAELRTDHGTHMIIVTVEDDGPGIDDADVPHLFEPFFRGSTAPRHAGAGLGLSLVERTAKAHGGTVLAENVPKGGARFTLALPASVRS